MPTRGRRHLLLDRREQMLKKPLRRREFLFDPRRIFLSKSLGILYSNHRIYIEPVRVGGLMRVLIEVKSGSYWERAARSKVLAAVLATAIGVGLGAVGALIQRL